MAITLAVTPGKVFQALEKITPAKLNQLGTPVIQIDGAFGPADMAEGDYSTVLEAGAYWYGVDTGVANTAQVNLVAPLTAYADGIAVAFKVAATNTGAVTLSVNGLAAQPVKKYGGTTDLAAGDWVVGQIVLVRYRLDPNIIPPAAVYSAEGTFTQAVVPGMTYTWTPSANDANIVNGATTLVAAGNFTATSAVATLSGLNSTGVTATLIPISNVWQMLSQLGNGPAVLAPFGGASLYTAGTQGLVPGPKVTERTFVLRADGTWFDAVTAATAAAQAGAGVPYMEIFKSFSFS